MKGATAKFALPYLYYIINDHKIWHYIIIISASNSVMNVLLIQLQTFKFHSFIYCMTKL